MGEIGIERDRFLYGLRHWEIQAIIRGYRRRQRPSWEQARLNAFYIMSAMSDLSKAGIRSDRDLITFPWEEKEVTKRDSLPSDEEVEEMRQMMKELNEQQTTKNERP